MASDHDLNEMFHQHEFMTSDPCHHKTYLPHTRSKKSLNDFGSVVWSLANMSSHLWWWVSVGPRHGRPFCETGWLQSACGP